jgi:multiple sugar transport system ATP-binding protein
MATIGISQVSKNYGPVSVMSDIDVTVHDGEFLVLVGPSGCGKSTLLRMIAGLETITGGEIAIGGRVVNKLPPRERDIAMVFQSYALYPHMTVEDNMGFNLTLKKAPPEEIKEKVGEAASILGLEDLLHRRPRELSGGQRQRVAMGRAIVRHPQVFLFDEPLSNLDAKLRVQMRGEIRALHDRLEATSVYVTHDQGEAMTMADRIVVLDKGHIAQIGNPLELYDRPANRFVAEFIGSPSINMVPARIDRQDDLSRLIFFNGTALDLPAALSPSDGHDVDVGIRPEHVRIAADGPFKAAVRLVEQLGPESLAFLEIGDVSVCCRTFTRPTFKAGDGVSVGFDIDTIHLFDRHSGGRLV